MSLWDLFRPKRRPTATPAATPRREPDPELAPEPAPPTVRDQLVERVRADEADAVVRILSKQGSAIGSAQMAELFWLALESGSGGLFGGSNAVLKVLLDSGWDPNMLIRKREGSLTLYPLELAVGTDNREGAKLLLAAGANPRCDSTEDGESAGSGMPLIIALRRKRLWPVQSYGPGELRWSHEFFLLFTELGTHLNDDGSINLTVLREATQKSSEAVDLIGDRGGDQTEAYNEALRIAAIADERRLVDLLITSVAPADRAKKLVELAVAASKARNRSAAVSLTLRAGRTRRDRWSPGEEVLSALRPEMFEQCGEPLWLAVSLGDGRMVKALLENGWDPNMPIRADADANPVYGLELAMVKGNGQIIHMLLDAGANPRCDSHRPASPDGCGRPLRLALQKCATGMVRHERMPWIAWLVEHGVHLNDDGTLCLAVLREAGRVSGPNAPPGADATAIDAVEKIAEAGSDRDRETACRAALRCAAIANNLPLVELLMATLPPRGHRSTLVELADAAQKSGSGTAVEPLLMWAGSLAGEPEPAADASGDLGRHDLAEGTGKLFGYALSPYRRTDNTTLTALLKAGCDPNQLIRFDDRPSVYPLELAMGTGNLEGARTLLEGGADPRCDSRPEDERDGLGMPLAIAFGRARLPSWGDRNLPARALLSLLMAHGVHLADDGALDAAVLRGVLGTNPQGASPIALANDPVILEALQKAGEDADPILVEFLKACIGPSDWGRALSAAASGAMAAGRNEAAERLLRCGGAEAHGVEALEARAMEYLNGPGDGPTAPPVAPSLRRHLRDVLDLLNRCLAMGFDPVGSAQGADTERAARDLFEALEDHLASDVEVRQVAACLCLHQYAYFAQSNVPPKPGGDRRHTWQTFIETISAHGLDKVITSLSKCAQRPSEAGTLAARGLWTLSVSLPKFGHADWFWTGVETRLLSAARIRVGGELRGYRSFLVRPRRSALGSKLGADQLTLQADYGGRAVPGGLVVQTCSRPGDGKPHAPAKPFGKVQVVARMTEHTVRASTPDRRHYLEDVTASVGAGIAAEAEPPLDDAHIATAPKQHVDIRIGGTDGHWDAYEFTRTITTATETIVETGTGMAKHAPAVKEAMPFRYDPRGFWYYRDRLVQVESWAEPSEAPQDAPGPLTTILVVTAPAPWRTRP